MKYIKIICCLLIVSVLSGPGIPVLKVFAEEESDAYPKGYYSGDHLPANTAYLTFDDGPSDWTEGILDTLREEKVKATFFICAYWNIRNIRAKNSFQIHKHALQRAVREGHVLGNHTAGHRVLSGLSPETIQNQFKHNQYYLDQVLGSESPFMTIFRPPLGLPWKKSIPLKKKAHVGGVIRKIGILSLWTRECDSSDSWDWARGEWYRKCPRINGNTESFLKKKERIYNRIISNADGRGMVILLHDTHLVSKEVLPSIIKELKNRGYVFRTMEDFVVWKYGKPSRELLGLK
jgi:peptidoglycan/xylan/chitin deacetylase (PgdA/CDA1 family)